MRLPVDEAGIRTALDAARQRYRLKATEIDSIASFYASREFRPVWLEPREGGDGRLLAQPGGTPDQGEGLCLGLDIRREARAIQRQVGYMTQKFSYYEDLTIRENLDFVARMYKLDRRRARVELALSDLGLADRQLGELEQQRAQLDATIDDLRALRATTVDALSKLD